MIRSIACLLFALIVVAPQLFAEDPVFSGPQVSEKLPALKIKGVFGEHAGKEFDFLKASGEKPVLIFFIHERTRPAFGLMRAITKYAVTRKDDGLQTAVIFLTGDATETEKWMNRVQNYFPKGVEMAVSLDGQSGPGAYGLNRNVTLTALVGKKQKTTANFALVQPSVQADGPKILKAIVEAVGSGEVPEIATLAARYQTDDNRQMANRDDPNLRPLLAAVINKDASDEDVKAAAKKVEEYVAKNKLAAAQLGRITNTVVNSNRFSSYGTKEARKYLKSWAEKYPAKNAAPSSDRRKSTDEKADE